MDSKLFLVDGSSLLYRSFYATRNPNYKQTQISAGFLFFRTLDSMIRKIGPTHILVAFDLPEPTFRHKKFKQYKQNRPETPQELIDQIPIIKNLLDNLKIKRFEVGGFEADDVIATYSVMKEVNEVVISSTDFDLTQLISNSVSILLSKANKYGYEIINSDNFFEVHQLWPFQIPDYKGLLGDKSDNLPGVKGVGEKTSRTLLNKYYSLNGIYENINSVEPVGLKQKLINDKEIAFETRSLAVLNFDTPIKYSIRDLAVNYDPKSALSFFEERGWKSLVKKYS